MWILPRGSAHLAPDFGGPRTPLSPFAAKCESAIALETYFFLAKRKPMLRGRAGPAGVRSGLDKSTGLDVASSNSRITCSMALPISLATRRE